MRINQIGHYVIHISAHDLSLNNILYVPQANKNIVSVHRFTHDNHVFVELHHLHYEGPEKVTRGGGGMNESQSKFLV
jgi:hypothetical protein